MHCRTALQPQTASGLVSDSRRWGTWCAEAAGWERYDAGLCWRLVGILMRGAQCMGLCWYNVRGKDM
ncbi:hypothetical protein ID866_10509 [Astraeus odoratus]|nr:hypothetical protein ID866_10509 [Astraeus odoratus]